MLSIEFIKQVGITKWATRYFIRQFKKRILKSGVFLTLPTGLTYYAPTWDPFASEAYVTNADTDWGSEYLMQQVLNKEGTFIDVGAHTGYYSLYMLPLVSWVYAFEPDAQSYEVLQRYSNQYKNLFTFRNAVSNQSGTMEIEVKGDGYTFIKNTSATSFHKENANKEQIKVVRLDDFINDYHSEITGIKIDVDGPDLDVLEGAIETITKFQPIVLIELSSGELERLFNICLKIGYLPYAFTKKKGAPYETKFLQLSIYSFENLRIKMIFLIPKSKKKNLTNLFKK